MSDVRPSMLVLARQSRGLTQTELAAKLQISTGMLSRMESGVRGVSAQLLRMFSDVLDYPAEFFLQDDSVYGFGTSELFHRRQQAVSHRTLAKIHANINIRRIHLTRLIDGAEMPEVTLPALEIETFAGRIEDAARAVRAWWNLPPGPVENITLLLENAGCLIIPFDFGSRRIDAISQWPPGMPPLIFVNPESPGDRTRMTLGHELCHLLLHQHSPEPDMEDQAFRFANEFLMPEREIRPYLSDLSLIKLATLKTYWKMSMAALLRRAEKMEAITSRQARRYWQHMQQAGYKTREPADLDIPPEPPTLYQELIDLYRHDRGYDESEFGITVKLFPHEVRHLYYGGPQRLRVVS